MSLRWIFLLEPFVLIATSPDPSLQLVCRWCSHQKLIFHVVFTWITQDGRPFSLSIHLYMSESDWLSITCTGTDFRIHSRVNRIFHGPSFGWHWCAYYSGEVGKYHDLSKIIIKDCDLHHDLDHLRDHDLDIFYSDLGQRLWFTSIFIVKRSWSFIYINDLFVSDHDLRSRSFFENVPISVI